MREILEFDILIVGGGPAGLSAALRLAQLQQQRGGEPLAIAVLEKAREAGAHSLSGAVLDPSTLAELIPDYAAKGAPLDCPVRKDDVYRRVEKFFGAIPRGKDTDETHWMEPPQTVPIQLNVLIAEGTAMTIVENEKVADSRIFIPLTNMW